MKGFVLEGNDVQSCGSPTEGDGNVKMSLSKMKMMRLSSKQIQESREWAE